MCIHYSGLLTKPNNLVIKKHDAGIVLERITKDCIITEKGKYRLNGPPQRNNETSKLFYEFWHMAGGFPKKFGDLAQKKKMKKHLFHYLLFGTKRHIYIYMITTN